MVPMARRITLHAARLLASRRIALPGGVSKSIRHAYKSTPRVKKLLNRKPLQRNERILNPKAKFLKDTKRLIHVLQTYQSFHYEQDPRIIQDMPIRLTRIWGKGGTHERKLVEGFIRSLKRVRDPRVQQVISELALKGITGSIDQN
jgi:hypothetical protein